MTHLILPVVTDLIPITQMWKLANTPWLGRNGARIPRPASWLLSEALLHQEKKRHSTEGGSKEGGKLPSGETSLGILAKEAFSLFCEGAERRRKGGKFGGIRGIEAGKKWALFVNRKN